MTTINEINSSIMFGNLTNDQLDSILMAIKYRRAQFIKENKRVICIGSNVQFYSHKKNQSFQGQVTKIAVKFITVRTAQGTWKVPANMLEVV